MLTDETKSGPAQSTRGLCHALEFYADPRRYDGANQRPIPDDPYAKPDAVYIMDVTRDHGAIARAALAPGNPGAVEGAVKDHRRSLEEIIASLNYDGRDADSLTVGEIRRALP